MTFALDDFGAGTTSFRYLRDFAFDIVKIDGQFTKNVAADADNQVMIQSLRSISDHFGMFTIAEPVECERDSQWLSETLVDCQLGYFWGGANGQPKLASRIFRERGCDSIALLHCCRDAANSICL
ncbi:MAG: EAL domain-containing protein [Paracoccaceae bacterium]